MFLRWMVIILCSSLLLCDETRALTDSQLKFDIKLTVQDLTKDLRTVKFTLHHLEELLQQYGEGAELDCNRRWSKATYNPGSPIPVKTNDPGVERATRFGVYRYNNMSNDIFLFKESHINKATRQVVRGLKYRINADISRTICSKRKHPDLDKCDFQTSKMLKQTFQCDFEVWVIPWLHKVQVLVAICQ